MKGIYSRMQTKKTAQLSYFSFIKNVAAFGLLLVSVILIALLLLVFNFPFQDFLQILLVLALFMLPALVAAAYYFVPGGLIASLITGIIALVLLNILPADIKPPVLFYPLFVTAFLLFGGLTGYFFESLNDLFSQLQQLKFTHTMSALYTREYLSNLVNKSIAEFNRYGSEFSIVLFEISPEALSSKHPIIKENLFIETAARIRENIRSIDEIGRYDNQFLIVLPHTPLEGARVVEQRILGILQSLMEEKHVSVGPSEEAVLLTTLAYPDNKQGLQKLLESLQKPVPVAEHK